jgi:hypothetical protein
MKLLMIHSFPAYHYFLPLRSEYSPQLPVLKHTLNLRYHVSHPYKTTGKIMVLYILIFKFIERRQEDKRLNRMVAVIPSI